MHSPREHFHTYLQSLDADRGGLPEAFRVRLGRVLGHYGVADLDATPELQEAVFRVFLAQQRTSLDVAVITALLQQWVAEEAPGAGRRRGARGPGPAGRSPPSCASRWSATSPGASGSVGTTSRWWRPSAMTCSTPSAPSCPTSLRSPEAEDHAARIDALAAIPEQIVRFLAQRLEQGVPEREPMLETLARRHYREHELHHLRALTVGRRPFVVADYTLDERPTPPGLDPRHHRRAGRARRARRPGRRARQVEAAPQEHQSVVDLYLAWPDAPQSPEEATARLCELLGVGAVRHRGAPRGDRGVPGGDREVSYFSFRPGPDGIVEDDLVRGVHPMVGRRLNLWRLRNFRITRLDAPEDVLLYHCVANDNEADQRLVALAQIRQFAIVRDQDGEVVSLPHAERAVASCLEAIRRARTSPDMNGAQLDMNHVWLHIWPVVDAQLDELSALQRTIAPLTAGAGIEEVLAAGPDLRPGRRPAPGGRAVLLPAGLRRRRLGHRRPHRAPAAAGRLRPEGPRGPSPRHRLPLRADPAAGRGGGSFVELDLDEAGALAPVDREPGHNKAGIVAGLATTRHRAAPRGHHPRGAAR